MIKENDNQITVSPIQNRALLLCMKDPTIS